MKHWNDLKTSVLTALSVGLWSILYPELIFGPDVCRAVDEGIMTQKEYGICQAETADTQEDYVWEELFRAGPKEIRIKSKIWEEVREWMDKNRKH